MHLTIRRAGFGALVASPRFSPPRAFPLSTESRLATSSLGRPGPVLPWNISPSLFLIHSLVRSLVPSFPLALERAYRDTRGHTPLRGPRTRAFR